MCEAGICANKLIIVKGIQTVHEQLVETLDLLDSEDETVQGEAILQLAMLLEKSNHVRDESGNVHWEDKGEILSPNLRDIYLDNGEQRVIVSRLTTLINSSKRNPSMLWALGKASPAIGIEPLLEILKKHSEEFDEDTAYQAILALGRFLPTWRRRPLSKIARHILENSPKAFLERMAKVDNPSDDPRLAMLVEHANDVLARLNRLFGNDYAWNGDQETTQLGPQSESTLDPEP